MKNIVSGSSVYSALLFVSAEEKSAFTPIRFILQSYWFLAKVT
ncbi:hypothetical protein [Pedobacter sp. Hv1]|nr:hypothetical protein [Pedobacter sp. Hv1]